MNTSNAVAAIQNGEPDQAIRDLFPLPLSPFERYMYLDDTAKYPMAFVLVITVTGTLHRDPFEESLQQALQRHPLLTCLIANAAGKGLCWTPAPNPGPRLQWTDEPVFAPAVEREQIDLTCETGMRVWVNRQAASAQICFQFHHACTDGLGGVQFIGDVLAFYGRKTAVAGAELPELEPVQIKRLLSRATYSSEPSQKPPSSVSCPWRLCKKLLKLLFRRPIPLAAGRNQGTSIGTHLQFPAMVSRMIERSVLMQLKTVAARKGVELNDLYLLELFQTIRDWNHSHGQSSDDRWLRIGMPTSLRTPLHDQMPASNIVSYMFLTRRAAECRDPDLLLNNIHRQTSTIVNEQQGRFLAIGLKYVLRLPGLLLSLLRMNRCFATAILSNVGDVKRQFTARFPLKQGRCVAGNITLETLKGGVPVRTNTRLSTSVGTYAGNLYINVHCDPHNFTTEQANELADTFVDRLRNLVPADAAMEQRAA